MRVLKTSGISKILTVFSLIFIIASTASANGYGTSFITISSQSITLFKGASATLNYTVNLASGNTWGTNLIIANQNELAANGVNIEVSNPSGDPPFSGFLTITAPTANTGSYLVILSATGDDPSVNNATFYVTVKYNINIAQNQSNQTNATAPAINNTSIVYSQPPATQQSYPTQPAPAYSPPQNNTGLISIFFIVIILIATAYFKIKYKSTPQRLITAGVALILIGIIAWLYGDYNGGLTFYIWSGVALIMLGTVIWLYGDVKHKAFKNKK
ncbi:MAG: hypothetical protein M1594_01270 [Candidatus Marsarchaeota archaeon]|nr:hypothetical protein [Candidatus Marsarchaeota archaeon]